MRKLALAALAAGIVSIVAIAVVAAHDDHSTGQWPTSCVDLNDIVEAHLGNDHNVGIYQRTFGDQAEAACRNDHRDDVRSVFAWALGSTVAPTQEVSLDTNWTIQTFHDEITGDETRVAFVKNEGRGTIAVGCELKTYTVNIYVDFGGLAFFHAGWTGPQVKNAVWRWNSDAHTSNAAWQIGDDPSTLFVPESHKTEIARGLINSDRVAFRALSGLGDGGDPVTESFSFIGSGIPNHPVAYIFGVCGRAI